MSDVIAPRAAAGPASRGTDLVTRRGAVRAIAAVAASSLFPACSRNGNARRVVLYTSADDDVAKAVVTLFERDTGVSVGVVTDTEATKTTGLVERLLDERSRPRADVWWSSEPLGTIRLAREGVLAEHTPGARAAGRPEALNARAKWFVMPGRARVIAYSTARVTAAEAPRRVEDLALSAWSGRTGMARPQFGTTRDHMAAIVATMGTARAREWMAALKAGGLRLYDGNAAVVRAIAEGEVDVGLADTDDVYSAERNRWKVGMATEEASEALGDSSRARGIGTIVLPNTAGVVAGAPHERDAGELLDFLLSEGVERLLASGESRHIPVRPSVARDFPQNLVPSPAPLDLEKVADAVPEAMRLCEDVFGR